MVPRNSSLVGGFAFICQSHLVIKKRTNSLFKRPSPCRSVLLKSLIIRACANAVISSWLRHYTGRHENHTGSIGLLFTHKNSCGAISVTERGCGAQISKEESHIRIGVHTITDSFACARKSHHGVV